MASPKLHSSKVDKISEEESASKREGLESVYVFNWPNLSNSYLKTHICSCLDKVKLNFAHLGFVLSFVYILFAFFIKIILGFVIYCSCYF